jgi:hypothetical protein
MKIFDVIKHEGSLSDWPRSDRHSVIVVVRVKDLRAQGDAHVLGPPATNVFAVEVIIKSLINELEGLRAKAEWLLEVAS